jgi:hypothetical protein
VTTTRTKATKRMSVSFSTLTSEALTKEIETTKVGIGSRGSGTIEKRRETSLSKIKKKGGSRLTELGATQL